MKQFVKAFLKGEKAVIRKGVEDFVNLFWSNLAHWSGMLWDPKRLPTIVYDFAKKAESGSRETISLAPWHLRLLMKLFIPRSFSQVKDMKRFISHFGKKLVEEQGTGIIEYVEEASKKDEHYFRLYEK